MDFTINMLETGMRYEGFLLVRSADQREGKTGGKYLDMNLTDKTGEVNCKLWDGNVPPPATGSVVKGRGLVQEYNGRKQLRIEKMRAADIVNKQTIARLYQIPEEDVLSIVYFPNAKAIKATIVRPMPSGALGERDVYGAQQHAPLMNLEFEM